MTDTALLYLIAGVLLAVLALLAALVLRRPDAALERMRGQLEDALREEQRAEAVHQNAGAGDHDHCRALYGCRIAQPLDRFHQDRAKRDPQQRPVGNGGQDRRAFQPIGKAIAGRPGSLYRQGARRRPGLDVPP